MTAPSGGDGTGPDVLAELERLHAAALADHCRERAGGTDAARWAAA